MEIKRRRNNYISLCIYIYYKIYQQLAMEDLIIIILYISYILYYFINFKKFFR